jgi:hypothetical protein
MRFTDLRDYKTVLAFNKELINTVVDTPVIIYKLNVDKTPTNIYGEATRKTWYVGTVVPCLLTRMDARAVTEVNVIDIEQKAEYYFLRNELNERDIYPDAGDVIEYDSQYYEIENITEIQQWAGQMAYDHQVKCFTHLMRKAPSQLERPIQ